jgi:hypothetical protein
MKLSSLGEDRRFDLDLAGERRHMAGAAARARRRDTT